MRLAYAFAMVAFTTPVLAQNARSVPDDFLSKMANDLSALRADPLPNETAVAAGQGSAPIFVPSTVQVDKDRATAWTSARSGGGRTVEWARGTEVPVSNSVPGWYEVERNDGSFWIPTNDVAPTGPVRRISTTSAPDPGWFSQQVEKLMKSATSFRDAYAGNPYLNVHGFSISLGLVPSVNVDFEFKTSNVPPPPPPRP
jgi:hypothetical protein